MGQEPSKPVSMEKTVMDMKLAAKKMEKESGKCATAAKGYDREALAAVEKGQMEVARIKAGSAMSNQKRSLSLLKLSAQMQAVADKLQDADRMKTLTGTMQSITTQLSQQLETMDLTKINECLSQFGKEFDDMDIITGRMDEALGKVVDDSAPTAQLDKYLMDLSKQAAAEAGRSAPAAVGAPMAALTPGVGQGPIGLGMGGGGPPGAPPGGGAGAGGPGPFLGGGGAGGGGGGDDLQAKLDRLKGLGRG